MYVKIGKLIHIIILRLNDYSPIPIGARPRAWVCGRSLAVTAGSNPARDMDVSLL
jgi:hypothetical protein